MQSETMTAPEQKRSIESGTSQLCDLAAAGLVPMFDPERRLFCYTYARTEAGMARQGISHRYTLMTLLGLRRYESSGRKSPIGNSAGSGRSALRYQLDEQRRRSRSAALDLLGTGARSRAAALQRCEGG